MTQLSFNNAADISNPLVCGLTPSGCIDVRSGSPEEGPQMSTATTQRILDAFNVGRGHGVLYLGAAEPGTELHPTLAYWRDIGQTFLARVCGALDPTDPKSIVIPEPSADELEAYAQSIPPMQGAELITPALLAELWSDVGKALTVETARYTDGVQGYLKKQNSVWNVVGRVCLHLAENKRDPLFPFAFIATYVHNGCRVDVKLNYLAILCFSPFLLSFNKECHNILPYERTSISSHDTIPSTSTKP